MNDSQEKILKEFFKSTWKTNSFDENLIAEIKSLNPRNVLDVGCGFNLYKGHIPNLYGIDIVNPEADLICDVLDFKPPLKYQVIMCLGSINFGTESEIIERLKYLKVLLEDDGHLFMRVNPGILWKEKPELNIFPWTKELIHQLGAKAGLSVDGDISEYDTPRGTRLRFTYIHSC
ncbi:MAG: hypothetical protein WC635_05900 [Bacteriovorax sp.]|jgi:hypothetical protein